MAAINMALLSADQLRIFNEARPLRSDTLLRLIASESRMFYCPTCDQMVTLVKPIAGFRAKPWRSDVFKWR